MYFSELEVVELVVDLPVVDLPVHVLVPETYPVVDNVAAAVADMELVVDIDPVVDTPLVVGMVLDVAVVGTDECY